MDPGPWTLAELVTAAEYRSDADWMHTAETLALMAECNRDEKKRSEPFTARDFHPTLAKKHKPATPPSPKVTMSELKTMLGGSNPFGTGK